MSMDVKIALEWDETCGLSLKDMYPFREIIEKFYSSKSYGLAIDHIWIVLACRPKDLKPRKRFVKEAKRLEYDILLDFFLIRESAPDQKRGIVRAKFLEFTTEAFRKYQFDFNTSTFLSDLESILHTMEW